VIWTLAMHVTDRSNARGVCMRCGCPVASFRKKQKYVFYKIWGRRLNCAANECILKEENCILQKASFRKKQKNVFYEMWSRRLNCAANNCISQEEGKCILQKATVIFAKRTMFRWLEF
jgi:ribosomal protein L20